MATRFHGSQIYYPMDAAANITQDQLVGHNGTTNLARALTAGDVYLGTAHNDFDNSTGAASALSVEVNPVDMLEVAVVGASGTTAPGTNVYASGPATFTLTSTSNSLVGKMVRHVSGTNCIVSLSGAQMA